MQTVKADTENTDLLQYMNAKQIKKTCKNVVALWKVSNTRALADTKGLFRRYNHISFPYNFQAFLSGMQASCVIFRFLCRPNKAYLLISYCNLFFFLYNSGCKVNKKYSITKLWEVSFWISGKSLRSCGCRMI